MKKKRRLLILLLLVLLSLSSCAQIRDFISTTTGSLIGQDFNILVYDSYGNNTMKMHGSRINIEIVEEKKNKDESMANSSSVLEITANGRQILQVGNTMIFAEKGLDMVEDFEMDQNLEIRPGGSIVPFNRYINDLKNKIGEDKTVVISTPMGTPIGVYQGKNVYVTVPGDLPKMTRLNIDGRSLYIHRANYLILDSKILD